MRRYSCEELEASQKQASSIERSPQVRSGASSSRPEPVMVYVDPVTLSTSSVPTSGPTDFTNLSSKAERIAHYKAERRRQLSERYGILRGQEAELDFAPCSLSRLEPDVLDTQNSSSQDRETQEAEEQGQGPWMPYCSGVGRVYMRTHPVPEASSPSRSNQAPLPTQEGPRGFSEQEKVLNVEHNHCVGVQEHSTTRTTTQEQHSTLSEQQQHHQSDIHQEPSVKDYSIAAMSSSPRIARRASLPSTRYGISPGDLFIEQQAQSVLNRHG